MFVIVDFIKTHLHFQRVAGNYLTNGCKDDDLKEQTISALQELRRAKLALFDAPVSSDENSDFQVIRRIKSLKKEVASQILASHHVNKRYDALTEYKKRIAYWRKADESTISLEALRAQDSYKSATLENLSTDSLVRIWLRDHKPELLANLDDYVESEKHKPTYDSLTKRQKMACMGCAFLGDTPTPRPLSLAFRLIPRLTLAFLVALKDQREIFALESYELAKKNPNQPGFAP